ncbi:amidohydrolase family protein [Aquabacterium fontiphilum]|uniref:amidohydrolase family protein n=1 Tax=Aquabacterium fontiphilum TaxID=450365 RepID=UPI0013784864|nr:amidohydrolase family protein [Aquabacterium fontiphilum]NBD21063.1 amidohydrolase family protein [Aquabacterium fontiphilum]
MSTVLIKNAQAMLTGLPGVQARIPPEQGRDLRVQGALIHEIGTLTPRDGERVIDASDCVLMPGWVNTHHHLFQSLLKGIPAGIDAGLMAWLSAVPVAYRRHFDHDAVLRLAARLGMVELLLSGCTTVADHQYHYYPGMPFDASAAVFEEAARLGVRFVLCRGGQTITRAIDVNPPPQVRPETLDQFLNAIERDVQRWHDPSPMSMRRVVSAPTTPTWSVAVDHLRPIAEHARSLGIRLHSHLSETADYVRYCREVHGCTPVDFVGEHGWLGDDVWYAHLVHLSPAEIDTLVRTGTGMAHCPQSNGRLGSGVAPAPAMLRAGGAVSLAVDGAASNEAADMAHEAHTAWLVHRAVGGPAALTTDEVVHMGTAGGARVLGLPGVGTLAVGQAADLVLVPLNEPRHWGLHDAGVAPVASGAYRARTVLCAGRVVVDNGEIPGLDLAQLHAEADAAVRVMMAHHA